MVQMDSPVLLQYLDILLKHGNYTKAAKDLYVSQPYLTQTIKKVEKELGIDIINRKTNPLQLTEAGRIYYQYLNSLETQQEQFLKKISHYSSAEGPLIRIGVLPSLGTYLLPLFVPDFMRKYPAVNVELYEDIPETNEKRLLAGELDFLIGQNPEMLSPNLIVHQHGKHGYYAVIPKKSRFYQKKTRQLTEQTMTIKELLQEELVLTSRGSPIRRQIDHLLQKYKVQPRIVLESNNVFTVRELAKQNLGIAFLPESIQIAVQDDQQHFNILPLSKELLSLDYFIAHSANKTLDEPEKALIDCFLSQLKHDFS